MQFQLLLLSCILSIIPILSACDAESITTPPENGNGAQSGATFGGTNDDYGNTILQTGDGGYLITGTTSSSDGDFSGLDLGNRDIFALKLNASGDLQWLNTYGGSDSDHAMDAIEDLHGNFVITGYSGSNDNQFLNLNRGDYDIFLLKIAPDGNLIWNRTFGGADEDFGHAIVEGSNVNYIITGSTRSVNGNFSHRSNPDKDLFIIRTLTDGTIDLIQTYGGSGDDEGLDVAIGSNSQISVTGSFESSDGNFGGGQPGISGAFLLKIEPSGVFNSLTTYSGSGADVANSLISLSDGGFAIAGRSNSNDGLFQNLNSGGNDAFVLKVVNNGNLQWVSVAGGNEYDEIHALTETETEQIIAAGESYSDDQSFAGLNRGGPDTFLLNLNPDGSANWLETYGGSNSETALSVTENQEGNFVFTGWTLSSDGHFSDPPKEGRDIFKLTVSPAGDIQ